MTPEQQRIAIAEACGWRDLWETTAFEWRGNTSRMGDQPIPNYLKDRNAMHDALSTLADNQGVTLCCHLNEMGITGEWDILTAKPDVLAEAFLRTIGKWVES
jgi:hypothetical protein